MPTKNKYPYPCCNCGACCMATPCPVAMLEGEDLTGIKPELHKPCPFLIHHKGLSLCSLVIAYPKMAKRMGMGEGCCMKGRAMNQETGIAVDWAGLPPEMKREIAARAQVVNR